MAGLADSPRSCFACAARGFAELVARIPSASWERPGLGVWTVRDLVGHASRAYSTIETYLDADPAACPQRLTSPAAYFLASRAALADAEAVARRGRDAAAALGDDPAAAVAQLARRVTALVGDTSEDTVLATPAGAMALRDYLPTRTFELVVHGLDLARALDLEVPEAFGPGIGASLALAADLGAALPTAGDLLLLLTGRTGLPTGLSVV